MAQQAGTGGLVALDGSRGGDLARAADALARRLRRRGVECAVSRWDASGLFGELAQDRAEGELSARSLTLLYAADLAFRLRWEIRPAIAAGRVVVAAGYVDTAAAFGAACGLSDDWLRHVFRFAPAPDALCRVRERKKRKGWKPRLDRGYGEYAAALLGGATRRGFPAKAVRRRMMEALAARIGPTGPRRPGRGRRAALDLGDTGMAEAARILAAQFATGSRQEAPAPSPSPPRSARTQSAPRRSSASRPSRPRARRSNTA